MDKKRDGNETILRDDTKAAHLNGYFNACKSHLNEAESFNLLKSTGGLNQHHQAKNRK